MWVAFQGRRRSHEPVSQNIQTLLAAIAGAPPYRILDLGCGPGRDLVAFRDLGHLVVGLDGCPEFVAMARAVSGCEVWQQDMLAMTLPPASFDGVFANAVLFHVPSRALPGVLDRLHAALKPSASRLPPTREGRTRRASSRAVTPASTVSIAGAGWSAAAALPWSITTTGRPASPAASSRGLRRSGASRHCQTSAALAEGPGVVPSRVGGKRDALGFSAACSRSRTPGNEDVRRTIAPDRLLVFDVAEGWAPLCAFLEVPVPHTPFPRANSTQEFQERVSDCCWGPL
jgi:SAM-dependent methyltransferase